MNDIPAYILKNRMKTLDNCSEFCQTFNNTSLKKFWPDNIVGFDVIAFDEFIKPKENESTYEAVERQFGVKAVELIKRLLA